MQTFLPYPNFDDSASVLDNQRLGKQRVENLQIMQAVLGVRLTTRVRRRIDGRLQYVELDPMRYKYEETVGAAWVNHPAVLMWKQTPRALYEYQLAICDEWDDRGYEDTCRLKTEMLLHRVRKCIGRPLMPSWLGNEQLHLSHQANLIRKNSTHYLPIFGPIPAMEYVWPVRKES